MRLGIVGLDSSRPLRVSRHLQSPSVRDHTLAMIVDEGDELPRELRELAPGAAVVRHPHEAIGEVDAIFDLGRRAQARRDRIAPLLLQGIHAFVDKPLALTSADATDLVGAARSGGAVLVSDSGFRSAVADIHAPIGASVVISGPADPRSPWGGLAFYGMHHAQLIDELGRAIGATVIDVHAEDGGLTAHIDTPAGEVRMRFDPTATRFSLTIDGATQPLSLQPDYLERLVDSFLADCAAPVHDDAWAARLIQPVVLLQEIMNRYDDAVRSRQHP